MARLLGYRASIQWLVDNDDTEWANHPKGHQLEGFSVTASLVADIFGVGDDKVRNDVRKGLVKAGRTVN